MARRSRNPRITLSSPARQRKIFRLLVTIVGLLVAILAALDHKGAIKKGSGKDWEVFDQKTAHVTRVVDGDTLHIRLQDGTEEKIRMLGIDAPEMHDDTTHQPAYWAQNATKYLHDRADGKDVILRLEPLETRDRYGRLLAYIYLSDADCLNFDCIHDGQVFADRRFKHSYKPQYEQSENEARRAKRGIWADMNESRMPAWRRAWLHKQDEP